MTLKDLDFQALNEVSRVVRLPRSVATAVMQQLEGDVAILQAAGVMDYSLLVGVYDHDPSHQCPPGAYLSQSGHQYYRFGIIDYLQKFSRMKRYECVFACLFEWDVRSALIDASVWMWWWAQI